VAQEESGQLMLSFILKTAVASVQTG